jgi:hypothetical protein
MVVARLPETGGPSRLTARSCAVGHMTAPAAMLGLPGAAAPRQLDHIITGEQA